VGEGREECGEGITIVNRIVTDEISDSKAVVQQQQQTPIRIPAASRIYSFSLHFRLVDISPCSSASPLKSSIMGAATISTDELAALKTNPKFVFFTDFDGTITLTDSECVG